MNLLKALLSLLSSVASLYAGGFWVMELFPDIEWYIIITALLGVIFIATWGTISFGYATHFFINWLDE